jgi:hypothetical protein
MELGVEWPMGLNFDSYEKELAHVYSAITFHGETFGPCASGAMGLGRLAPRTERR